LSCINFDERGKDFGEIHAETFVVRIVPVKNNLVGEDLINCSFVNGPVFIVLVPTEYLFLVTGEETGSNLSAHVGHSTDRFGPL
jgi:hypothetical protein